MITLGNLTVTDEDLDIIAHVVHNETPEAWATRAFNYPKGGVTAVINKISRYRESYLASKDDPGYQTAAERMAERRDEADIRAADNKARAVTKAAEDEEALDARINAEVARQIQALA